MSALETAASTAAGLLLIVLAGRDIFDALFHPEGRATLGRFLARAVWLAFRRVWPDVRRLPLAGPLALLTVIGSWALMLAIGWALLYLPHISDGFRGTDGSGDFVDALYLSLATLTTLGFGDLTPTADWLRLITPLEALLGFGLLSASISWLLLIYPVLGRRRSLAYENFAESDERFAMPAAAPYLRALAERGEREHTVPRARLRARLLREAIDDFAATTAERFHGTRADSTEQLLRAYARDHLRSD